METGLGDERTRRDGTLGVGGPVVSGGAYTHFSDREVTRQDGQEIKGFAGTRKRIALDAVSYSGEVKNA